MWDHPRACGKHGRQPTHRRLLVGSPPRLRETLGRAITSETWKRITPAPAGNTLIHCLATKIGQDHPRACGKHLDDLIVYFEDEGSPPRLRETRNRVVWPSRFRRITPAPAGNTGYQCFQSFFHGDHPRACGKHCRVSDIHTIARGSPPRLRETLRVIKPFSIWTGITPAPAGNTFTCDDCGDVYQDHPRACGKHFFI